MVSVDQIRLVCAKVAAEPDNTELAQLLAGLTMMCTQYLREHSQQLQCANDSPPTPQSRTKAAARKIATGGSSSNEAHSDR
jgi:hypothetical protein